MLDAANTEKESLFMKCDINDLNKTEEPGATKDKAKRHSSILTVPSNIAGAPSVAERRMNNVHNLDLRAMSGVFSDQQKFWMTQE